MSIKDDAKAAFRLWSWQCMEDVIVPQVRSDTLREELLRSLVEQRQLSAEAGKITLEVFWYPITIATGIICTVSTATAVLINLIL
jgi:hypothetical protein